MEQNHLIQNFLTHFAQAGANATAFSLYDGDTIRDVSYHDFLNDILCAAGYFRTHGIHGQHIAIAASNSYEWLVVFMAILASGNVAVLINQMLPIEQISEQCVLSDASLIWCDETLAVDLPKLDYAVLTAAEPMNAADVPNVHVDDTILLLGTSGTTGQSKIVEITAGNVISSLKNSAGYTPAADMERYFLVLPLFHIGGTLTILTILARQQTVCIGRGMRYLLSDMPLLNPTYVSVVPSILDTLERIFRNTPDAEKRTGYIGRRLRRIFVGGAAPKPSTCSYFTGQGLIIETAYGMTESCGDGTWCELTEDIVGTIGKPRRNSQYCIKNGELLFKSDSVMKGYYKDPEETAKVIDADGWLHTGDMGRCDENGYYYVTGRIKNVIILSNGENVNPEEIEAELGKCSAIRECMVYSDGKGICADVYTEDEEEARLFIRQYNENMPMYRQVYKVLCQGEPLEKTPTGKIKRKENR